MRVLTTDQLSQEWFSARVGRVTASRCADAMRRLQKASGGRKAGEWHGDHIAYVRELSREMRTGIPAWHRVTFEMEYGTAHEPDARKAYAAAMGVEVKKVGLVLHPTYDYLASSPDGLVGEDGGIEIKVPALKTHDDTVIDDTIPEQYLPQIYCNMLCCEREWWDFVSYCPRDIDDDERLCYPDDQRLFVKRIRREDAALEINGEKLTGEAVFRRIEEDARKTIEEALEINRRLESRHLRLPAVEMPKEMLLEADNPIF